MATSREYTNAPNASAIDDVIVAIDARLAALEAVAAAAREWLIADETVNACADITEYGTHETSRADAADRLRAALRALDGGEGVAQ